MEPIWYVRLSAVVLLLLPLAGCASGECRMASDCPAGRDCVNQVCEPRSATPDAGAIDASIGTDAGQTDAGNPDGGALDAGATDAGPVDAGRVGPDGSPCEPCSAGEEETEPCGARCRSRRRTCVAGCFGAWSACADDDGRCTASSAVCRNDYCWSWVQTAAGGLPCLDLSADGSISFTVRGRPSATYQKDNRDVGCAGDWAPASASEGGTLDATGIGSYTFPYSGLTECGPEPYGDFASRMVLTDTDGTRIELPNVFGAQFYNSTCTSAAWQTCAGVAGTCPGGA